MIIGRKTGEEAGSERTGRSSQIVDLVRDVIESFGKIRYLLFTKDRGGGSADFFSGN